MGLPRMQSTQAPGEQLSIYNTCIEKIIMKKLTSLILALVLLPDILTESCVVN
jgi:hypothetical protein